MIYGLDDIKNKVASVAEKYQIPALYVFGSYARKEANEQSDIDFLVDTTGTKLTSLFSLGALYVDLEKAVNKPIDLITVNSLHQHGNTPVQEYFSTIVWKEKVSVYELS